MDTDRTDTSTVFAQRREKFCAHLYALALQGARRVGLRGEQAEEHALEVVERALLEEGDAAWLVPPWRYMRSADNWARNALRQQRRLAHHERPWSELERLERAPPTGYLRRPAPAPDVHLLRLELRRLFLKAAEQLAPAQNQLLVLHYLLGYSVQELAYRTGRSANAIRQSLWVARQRLRTELEAQGLDAAEAADYLRLLAWPP